MRSAILRAPKSASADIEPVSVPVSSSTCLQSISTPLVAYPSTSSPPPCPSSPSADIQLPLGSAVPLRQLSDRLRTGLAQKTTDSTRGLEECSPDPSAPSPLRGACQSPSARPRLPPALRPSHQRFEAPKNLSTPRDSALDPASFAFVESPSGLRRTLPITLLMLPIQPSQRTCDPSHTNLRGSPYASSCLPFVSTEPLV